MGEVNVLGVFLFRRGSEFPPNVTSVSNDRASKRSIVAKCKLSVSDDQNPCRNRRGEERSRARSSTTKPTTKAEDQDQYVCAST